jgi:hypothetical protein
MSQALFAIHPVIELCPIHRSREHVEAVLQDEQRPRRRFHGWALQRLASQLLGELLGEPKSIRARERSDCLENVAHAVHIPTLARFGLGSI